MRDVAHARNHGGDVTFQEFPNGASGHRLRQEGRREEEEEEQVAGDGEWTHVHAFDTCKDLFVKAKHLPPNGGFTATKIEKYEGVELDGLLNAHKGPRSSSASVRKLYMWVGRRKMLRFDSPFQVSQKIYPCQLENRHFSVFFLY